MTTMLMVVSGMCLLGAFLRPLSAPVVAPAGAASAVAASFLIMPPGPLALPVAVATGLVAAIGLAAAFGLLHPPAPDQH